MISLRNKALQMLGRRDHSRAELAQKLQAFTETPEEIPALLDDFEARGWLSDSRFAEQWTHYRSQRYGLSRLKQELRQRGVASEIIDSSIEAVAEQEEATARRLWLKKFGSPPKDQKERAKQMRFLASRGFSTAVIYRVVSGNSDDFIDDMEFD
ncbi:recombination regulator RecX [Chitinibacter bivalviorum]|uniref:Regulatory protein RecX n=1 Tax=Chitinibacter bivalviorum TaxID=2739434 RepID=A0A7H9BFF3_9NEIS|nr:recombination regulator RecX [Chitinibacter bivalviorum]QLG87349.1 recombination regulator RecX [Chitinibacter bivalviorum]